MGMNTEIKTTVELKRANLRSVYHYVYKAREASRLDMANNTGLSFPTVADNIQLLLDRNLMENCGEQKSTGGRKAAAFRINRVAAIAFGVEILKESIQIAAVDLYGEILGEDSLELNFSPDDNYYRCLGAFINGFCDSFDLKGGKSLGVCLAIQGLISPDGQTIAYSQILRCTGVSISSFQKYIRQPCILVHDTDVAALAECWHDDSLSAHCYLALNRNFGGTILYGPLSERAPFGMTSATVEHICIDPNGPECYCGNRGCIETFCGANVVSRQAGMEIPAFFDALHAGDEKCRQIWEEFVGNLAILINNISMVMNPQFIIGGYMAQYMQENDFIEILEAARGRIFDPRFELRLRPGHYGDSAPKVGAAIALIDSFINSI